MTRLSATTPIAVLTSTAMITLATDTARAQTTTTPAVTNADTANGTITGRMYDEVTGQSLRGAIVRVVSTNAQDYTLEDGRFQLTAPAGQVTLQIDYVGLDTATYTVRRQMADSCSRFLPDWPSSSAS